jgi:alpha-tubulin suppressor-like RCC1 family protein
MRDFYASYFSASRVARATFALTLVLGVTAGCESHQAGPENEPAIGTSRSAIVLPVEDAKLGAGPSNNCAVLPSGLLKCWGDNSHFQLGIGPGGNRGDDPGEMGSMLPAVNLGTGLHARSVAVSSFQTCALLGDGTVECWGTNESGALGIDGTDTVGDVPGEMGDQLHRVHLPTGQPVRSLVAGASSFFCVLYEAGDVQCWGRNQFGQLGLGDSVDRGSGADPSVSLEGAGGVSLGSARTAQLIAAGSDHACAILDNGSVKCWGANGGGQLGIGNTDPQGDSLTELGDNLHAVSLGVGRTAVSLVAGRAHTCAKLDNGAVKCWGDNTFGQLGNGEVSGRGASTTPDMGDNLPAVNLGGQVTALTAGADHTCAILDTGVMKCWGKNDAGQLGIESNTSLQRTPVSVSLGALRTVRAAAAGGSHTCARLDDASIKCWGSNAAGETGLGMPFQYGKLANTMGDKLPTVSLQQSMSANASGFHTCQVLQDGSIKCWGQNVYGQLGIDERSNNRGASAAGVGVLLPRVYLGNGRTALQVSTGRAHTCALLDDHSVKCWGANNFGQLGQDNTTSIGTSTDALNTLKNLQPVNLGAGRSAVSISVGGDTSCAVLDNATLKCWGANNNYQLGNNTTVSRGGNPGDMAGLPIIAVGAGMQVRAVSVGNLHVCVLLNNGTVHNGTVKCWGQNQFGQLGIGNFSPYQKVPPVSPVALATGDVVVSVAAGGAHTCALLDTGAIKCWGRNTYGQSGIDGTGVQGFTADPIAAVNLGGAPAIAVDAGSNHTCALLGTGAVRCWGNYEYGAIGPFSRPGSSTPNKAGDEAGDMAALADISLGTGAAAVAIAAQANSTCALLKDGREKCWGYNVYGQLGQGFRNANNAVGYIASEMGDALTAVVLGVDPNLRISCPTRTNDDTYTFSVSGNFGYGVTTLTTNSPEPPGSTGIPAPTVTTTIQLAGQDVIRTVADGQVADGKTKVTVDYGPGVQGISHSEFFNDGTTITGSVNGHAIVPVPVSQAGTSSPYVFQDGTAFPTLTMGSNISTSAAAIADAAAAALTQCGPVAPELVFDPLPPPAPPPVTPGQAVPDFSAPGCNKCTGTCDDLYTACDIQTSNVGSFLEGIGSFFKGIFTGNLPEAAGGFVKIFSAGFSQGHNGCVAAQGACWSVCRSPGQPCCPVGCGAACCNSGTVCVDPQTGLCCPTNYSACPGIETSTCFDPGRAFCLPSGRACVSDTPTCGQGVQAVCCASNICVDNVCHPQANFNFNVRVTATQNGATLCGTGVGFTPAVPGMPNVVTVEYIGLPGKTGRIFVQPTPVADAAGTFDFFDRRFETVSLVSCDTTQLQSQVTVIATDTIGSRFSATFPAAFFCLGSTTAGSFNGGCQ